MNWYKIFYWLTVADNFKLFFIVGIVVFSLIAVIATIVFLSYLEAGSDEDIGKDSKIWMWRGYMMLVVFWTLYLFTPNKSDTLLIIAGGAVGNFITSDSSSQAIPADITRFLHVKLQTEIAGSSDELKRQLNMQTPKERLIDKAKDLTKEELIRFLENDSTLIK